MELSLKEISELVQGTLVGDGKILIKGVAGIKEAQDGQITFLSNPKYFTFVAGTKASAVLISQEVPIPDHKAVIVCKSPSLAFSKVVERFNPVKSHVRKGVHATALLGEGVWLGKEVSIGPYVVIEDHVTVGDRSIIGAGSFLGYETKIGEDAHIYPNVTVRESINIGNRVVIHSGTVIGSDGFGYETVEGVHHKIPQVGTVVIEDDVELGANVTIDRARFGKTVIGKGTKVDNLVQIAHNVEIGEHCMIVAQVGISGTTKIGRHVTLAGQVGLVGHIEIGDRAVVTAQSGVSKNIAAGEAWGGYPAVPLQEWRRTVAHIRHLDKLVERLKALERKIQDMENR